MAVVVRMAAHQAQDVGGGCLPDFLENLAGKGVQTAERLVEQQDLPASGFTENSAMIRLVLRRLPVESRP